MSSMKFVNVTFTNLSLQSLEEQHNICIIYIMTSYNWFHNCMKPGNCAQCGDVTGVLKSTGTSCKYNTNILYPHKVDTVRGVRVLANSLFVYLHIHYFLQYMLQPEIYLRSLC